MTPDLQGVGAVGRLSIGSTIIVEAQPRKIEGWIRFDEDSVTGRPVVAYLLDDDRWLDVTPADGGGVSLVLRADTEEDITSMQARPATFRGVPISKSADRRYKWRYLTGLGDTDRGRVTRSRYEALDGTARVIYVDRYENGAVDVSAGSPLVSGAVVLNGRPLG